MIIITIDLTTTSKKAYMKLGVSALESCNLCDIYLYLPPSPSSPLESPLSPMGEKEMGWMPCSS